MKTSQAGIDHIKKYESFSATIYICPGGLETIGYGHAVKKKEHFDEPITEAQAETILQNDLAYFERHVLKKVKVKLNQNQFDALSSFVFQPGNQDVQRIRLHVIKVIERG